MAYRNIKSTNGLNSTYNNNNNLLKLGGILTENTNIDIPNYYFSITGLNSGGSFKLDETSSLWNLNSGLAILSLGSTDTSTGASTIITTTPIYYQLQVNDNISNISGITIEPYYINQAVTDGAYSSTLLQSASTIALSAQDNLGNTSSMEINPITIKFLKGTVYSMWHNQGTSTINTREDIFLCLSGSTVTIGDENMIHGRVLTFKDKLNNSSGNPITIIPNTGATIDFLSSYTINKDFGSVSMVYDQYTNRWYTISRDESITADNGLTKNTSTNFRLGGTLLANTTISTGAFQFDIASTSNTSRLTLNNGTTTLRASSTMLIQTPNIIAGTSQPNRILNLINQSNGQTEFSVLANRSNLGMYFTQRWINGGAVVIPRATGGIPSIANNNCTASTGGVPSTTITITVGGGSYIGIGAGLSGVGIPLGTYVVSQSTGSTGATGDYIINNSSTVTVSTVIAITSGIFIGPSGTNTFVTASRNFNPAADDYLVSPGGGPGGAFFTYSNTIGNFMAKHTLTATVISSITTTLLLMPVINYVCFVDRGLGTTAGQLSNIAGLGYSQGVICTAGVPTKIECEYILGTQLNVGMAIYRNINGINDLTSTSITCIDVSYDFHQI